MEFLQTLLEVLWRDIRFRGFELFAFSLALAVPSYGLAFLARVFIHGTPRDIIWKGTLWGWLGGIVSFILVRIGVGTYDYLVISPYITPYGFKFFLTCLLVGCCVSLAQSTIYFYRRRRLGEVASRRRPVFSLRTFVIGQMLLATLMGWWITTKRREIEMRIEGRHQTAEFERQQRQKAACEARFSPYGWNVLMYPEIRQTMPQLRLLPKHYNQPLTGFHDGVLAQITPAERIVSLHITSDALTDEGLKTIGSFTTLESLKIRSTRITDAGLANLTKLHNLKELSIYSDQITDAGVAKLKHLPALVKLNVRSSELTQDSFAHLAEIKSLKNGYIWTSQITVEQQREFLNSRPPGSATIYASVRWAELPPGEPRESSQ